MTQYHFFFINLLNSLMWISTLLCSIKRKLGMYLRYAFHRIVSELLLHLHKNVKELDLYYSLSVCLCVCVCVSVCVSVSECWGGKKHSPGRHGDQIFVLTNRKKIYSSVWRIKISQKKVAISITMLTAFSTKSLQFWINSVVLFMKQKLV